MIDPIDWIVGVLRGDERRTLCVEHSSDYAHLCYLFWLYSKTLCIEPRELPLELPEHWGIRLVYCFYEYSESDLTKLSKDYAHVYCKKGGVRLPRISQRFTGGTLRAIIGQL